MPLTRAMSQGKTSPIYIVTLTLFFLALTSLISIYALNSIEKDSRLQLRDSLQTVLQTTITSYHTWVDFRVKDASYLAANPIVSSLAVSLIDNKDSSRDALVELRRFMQPELAKQNDQGFFVIDKNRISIASMRDSNLHTLNLIHMQRPEFLNRAFEGESIFVPTLISDVPLGNQSNNLSAFVLSPIRQNETIIAVLAIRLNLNTFFTHLPNTSQLGDSGETYAFDRYGVLITNSRFEHQLKRAGLVAPDGQSILNLRITDPGGNLLKGYKPTLSNEQQPLTLMAASAIKGESGVNVEGYRDYRGVTVVGAWAWLEGLGFGITTEMDIDEALSPYYKTRNTLIGVLITTVSLAILLVGSILKINSINKRQLRQAYNSLETRVKERTQELHNAKLALEHANSELAVLATTDGLTGLANRRSFDQHLEQELLRSRREKKSLGIIMFDIDYFKQYNDYYGHQKGDECLSRIAEAVKSMQSIRRPGDMIARYGGEEFIIVLNNPDHQYISNVCEQLLFKVQSLDIPHTESQLSEKKITVSIGYTLAKDVVQNSAADLILKADIALYTAKSSGRNRVIKGESEAKVSPDNEQSLITGKL